MYIYIYKYKYMHIVYYIAGNKVQTYYLVLLQDTNVDSLLPPCKLCLYP